MKSVKAKNRPDLDDFLLFNRKKFLGNDLLSQGVAPQVPSALTCLTTGFGMLPGVPTSLRSPRDFIHLRIDCCPTSCLRRTPEEYTVLRTTHEALDH